MNCECNRESTGHRALHCPNSAFYYVLRDGKAAHVCTECVLSEDKILKLWNGKVWVMEDEFFSIGEGEEIELEEKEEVHPRTAFDQLHRRAEAYLSGLTKIVHYLDSLGDLQGNEQEMRTQVMIIINDKLKSLQEGEQK